MTNNFLSHLCLCIKPEYENIKTVNLEEKDKKSLIETGLINNINIDFYHHQIIMIIVIQ